ncbi:MAG: hypothetical protein LLG37_05020 [Spirochaetia bacterium]|nr:hypothetical protein [Spirochaetia bacterium]
MSKNLFTPGEYDIKDTPYRLRGSFLSKKVKPEEAAKEQPVEESASDRLERLEEEANAVAVSLDKKKQELSRLEIEMEQLKEKSEAEAKAVIERAQMDAQEIKTNAQKQGFDSGFEKGYFEGLEKGKNEIDAKYAAVVATIQSIAETALSEKHKIIRNTEDDIVKLSIDVARKVVDQEISVKPEVVVNFVNEAIKMLENREKITIYCNPADIDLLKSHREDFKKITDITETLHILPDELLERGECRLESVNQIVDTDINYQFSEISKKLNPGE